MKPILFNTEMVQAILAGRKTQTRRLVKPRYRAGEAGFQVITNKSTGQFVRIEVYDEWEEETRWLREPCRPGDVLYVRETWFYEEHMESMTEGAPDLPSGRYSSRYIYRADDPDYPVNVGVGATGWRPSIFMPKEAARIFLQVNDVRAERLQKITAEGIRAEGSATGAAFAGDMEIAAEEFALLWDSTIPLSEREHYGWRADPWVWVITFERIRKEETET